LLFNFFHKTPCEKINLSRFTYPVAVKTSFVFYRTVDDTTVRS
jgi:hypothetical protein